jgi:CPA1 family monovalent cation:H+ antiporter
MNPVPLMQEAEPGVIQLETILIVGLILITAVALLVKRFRFPYTVTLVFVGLLLAVLPTGLPLVTGNANQFISSELILALFVPPLVFEGALNINWKKFQSNLIPIVLMAVIGVLLAAFIVGGLIMVFARGFASLATALNLPVLDGLIEIPFIAALAFGALISATDPVAVIAFFRSLGVDKRLSILMEGESLLNDGTSIVIFKLALTLGGAGALIQSHSPLAEFTVYGAIWEFLKVALGGVIVGLLVGRISGIILKNTDARLVETTITIVTAFGAYVLAERFHLSGILSVVAAGMSLGNVIPMYTSPTTKIVLDNFWEVLSFIVTSLIFLIIGWIIDIRHFISLQNLVLVLAGVIAILIARALVVYGMSFISNIGLPLISRHWRFIKVAPIPKSFQHVMFWGGLRGAISLALALSIGPNIFGPGVGDQLRLMTFGVVLFTLIVQGTSIERLIKRLGLAVRSERQLEKERYLGNYYINLAGEEELRRLHESGILSGTLWKVMEEIQRTELAHYDQAVREMLSRHPGLSIELALQARHSILNAERTALIQAVSHEIISQEVQEEMLEELDAHLDVLDRISDQIHSAPRLITDGDEQK